MSGLLTKQYFETMDIIYKEANYDMLNLAKLGSGESIVPACCISVREIS